MVISFKVVNQTLYPVQTPSYMEPVYANSIGYLYAQFTFSSDWDELNSYISLEAMGTQFGFHL